MLRETLNVAQHDGEPYRRWFGSEYFDLIVWYGNDNSIIGFELCYGKPNNEKVFCWSHRKGYRHLKVDDGEVEPLAFKKTPIYIPDGLFDESMVTNRFIEESAQLEEEIRDYVVTRITNHTL